MARQFLNTFFGADALALQERAGSRASYARMTMGGAGEPDPIGPSEAAFIAERDSFYLASRTDDGWPYIQHRGGPAGFLKVLDERTIGYADFSGNAQYVSVGNLSSDDRISLILVDYVHRRRLKLMGHARIVHENEHPALLAQLEVPTYRARVERGVDGGEPGSGVQIAPAAQRVGHGDDTGGIGLGAGARASGRRGDDHGDRLARVELEAGDAVGAIAGALPHRRRDRGGR